MARPKSGKELKSSMHLSISKQARAELEFISRIRQQSISQILEEYAKKEAKRLAKQTNSESPNADQIEL